VNRSASNGSLGVHWASTSGLPRGQSGSNLHAAQHHPGCHWPLENVRDEHQLPGAAVRTVLRVDVESQASAKTNLYPSNVAANTPVYTRAQLIRCGRTKTVSTSQTAAVAASVGDSTPCFAQRGAADFAQRSYSDTKLIRFNCGLGTSAASRSMNTCGLMTRCVVPSDSGVLSLSSNCPLALSCTRPSESAARLM
jgi:hypothetical protein